MKEALLDPTGASERETDTTLTPRPGSLRGLTVGLLENTKPNAVPLLKAVGHELTERYGVREVRLFRKGYFGTPGRGERGAADLLRQRGNLPIGAPPESDDLARNCRKSLEWGS